MPRLPEAILDDITNPDDELSGWAEPDTEQGVYVEGLDTIVPLKCKNCGSIGVEVSGPDDEGYMIIECFDCDAVVRVPWEDFDE